MSRLSLPRWIDHPAARVLGLVFLVRDLVLAVLAVGAVVTGALADGGALSAVAVVLGVLALAGVVISALARRRRPRTASPVVENEIKSAPRPPPPPHRTGVEIEGGSFGGRNVRIRNQDTGIRSKDSDIDVDDAEIE
jgi:hypothetical protein